MAILLDGGFVTKKLGGAREVAREDVVPDIEQEGVDLLIGLDVASLAVKSIVDTVVLVSGDSDLVPAMKLARREGLRVYLHPLGHRVRKRMLDFADVVIQR